MITILTIPTTTIIVTIIIASTITSTTRTEVVVTIVIIVVARRFLMPHYALLSNRLLANISAYTIEAATHAKIAEVKAYASTRE
jgi:hypothetical protein